MKCFQLHQAELLGKKLEILRKVQRNYRKAESSETIKITLRYEARKKSKESYEKVYYKRSTRNGWRVLEKVLGKKKIFYLQVITQPPIGAIFVT